MKQKAEEIYHRFVNYEWNDVGEGLKKSILEAIETALKEGQKLPIHSVVKSLPIQDLQNCTRVEVIDQKGRSYVNWKPTNKVRLSMQDDGKTAKIFID